MSSPVLLQDVEQQQQIVIDSAKVSEKICEADLRDSDKPGGAEFESIVDRVLPKTSPVESPVPQGSLGDAFAVISLAGSSLKEPSTVAVHSEGTEKLPKVSQQEPGSVISAGTPLREVLSTQSSVETSELGAEEAGESSESETEKAVESSELETGKTESEKPPQESPEEPWDQTPKVYIKIGKDGLLHVKRYKPRKKKTKKIVAPCMEEEASSRLESLGPAELESQEAWALSREGAHFNAVLRGVVEAMLPSEEDRRKREELVGRVEMVLSRDGLCKGCQVLPFGSFESDIWTKWGDLDLCMLIPRAQTNDRMFTVNALRSAVDMLIRQGLAFGVQRILNARVPLVIFSDTVTRVPCDLSCGNTGGVTKSRVLGWLLTLDSRCKPLIFLVKCWAKAGGINDPKNGSLNSYALCLLVIFHLQTCSPPILPPFKEVLGSLEATRGAVPPVQDKTALEAQLQVIQARMERVRESGDWGGAGDPFQPAPALGGEGGAGPTRNTLSVGALFASFMAKYAAVGDLWAKGLVVRPYSAEWGDCTSQDLNRPKRSTSMVVEDPFDFNENCARSVRDPDLERITEYLKTTASQLSSPPPMERSQALKCSLFQWHETEPMPLHAFAELQKQEAKLEQWRQGVGGGGRGGGRGVGRGGGRGRGKGPPGRGGRQPRQEALPIQTQIQTQTQRKQPNPQQPLQGAAYRAPIAQWAAPQPQYVQWQQQQQFLHAQQYQQAAHWRQGQMERTAAEKQLQRQLLEQQRVEQIRQEQLLLRQQEQLQARQQQQLQRQQQQQSSASWRQVQHLVPGPPITAHGVPEAPVRIPVGPGLGTPVPLYNQQQQQQQVTVLVPPVPPPVVRVLPGGGGGDPHQQQGRRQQYGTRW